MNPESENADFKKEITHLNEKLTAITANLDSQQKNFEEKFTTLASIVEAMSIIRYYAARNETMTCQDLENGAISCIQRLEEIRFSTSQQDLQEYIQERMQFIFGALLDLAKRKQIVSGELLSTFKEHLDAASIEAIVNLNDVSRVYGTTEATNWKKLLFC